MFGLGVIQETAQGSLVKYLQIPDTRGWQSFQEEGRPKGYIFSLLVKRKKREARDLAQWLTHLPGKREINPWFSPPKKKEWA